MDKHNQVTTTLYFEILNVKWKLVKNHNGRYDCYIIMIAISHAITTDFFLKRWLIGTSLRVSKV